MTEKYTERPLPPLIRTSDVSRGPIVPGASPTRRLSPPDPPGGRASLQRRRDKLRAVLALMDTSKIKKGLPRDRDRLTGRGDSQSVSLLEAGQMWGRHRRGAIADGVLPTRSPGRERSTLEKKQLVVRVSRLS